MSGPADAGAAAHVFVDDLDEPVLREPDRHHLERVLRLRTGDQITVADGAGRWRTCLLGDSLVTAGPIISDERLEPELTVGVALVKGERPELVVQKLVELGIDHIVLFRADRSVVRWDATRAARAAARLETVGREAAMQSRRARLAEISVGASFAELAALPRAALAQRGGGPLTLEHPIVLVGPEGGWSPDELGAGLPTVDLSDAVLRSETAALTVAAGLTSLRRERTRKRQVTATQGD
jgi:16S rRNA (uracil1498-N3)-methyltransferase